MTNTSSEIKWVLGTGGKRHGGYIYGEDWRGKDVAILKPHQTEPALFHPQYVGNTWQYLTENWEDARELEDAKDYCQKIHDSNLANQAHGVLERE